MGKLNIAYTRVSTTKQVEEGYSLSAQRKATKGYYKYMLNAKEKEIKFIADEGYSGRSSKRPGYQELSKLIKEDKVKRIVIHKIDRLGRNMKNFASFLDECLKRDIEFVSIQEGINLQTPMGRCVANILMSIASYESDQIGERTVVAMQEAMEQGVYALGGSLPLGIDRTEDNGLVYNDDIKIVKEIFELDSKGHSYAIIKREIEQKYNINLHNKNRVHSIVKNTLYQGYKIFNGVKYYFLDPIVEFNNNESEARKFIEMRKRNIVKHSYAFSSFLTKDFTFTTTKKKLRTTGKFNEYKYYIHKNNNALKINEETIINKVYKKFNKMNKEIQDRTSNQLRRVRELYIEGMINLKEMREYNKSIKGNKRKVNLLEGIEQMKISSTGILELILNGYKIKINLI